MAKKTSPLLPVTELLLQRLGERLRLARLRRRLQSQQVAERAGLSLVTLRKIERGNPGVTMGAYLSVLQVLQLEEELNKVAVEDKLGRHLQDIEGEAGMRPRRRRRTLPSSPPLPAAPDMTIAFESNAGRAEEEKAVSGDDLFAFLLSLDPAKKEKGAHGR